MYVYALCNTMLKGKIRTITIISHQFSLTPLCVFYILHKFCRSFWSVYVQKELQQNSNHIDNWSFISFSMEKAFFIKEEVSNSKFSLFFGNSIRYHLRLHMRAIDVCIRPLSICICISILYYNIICICNFIFPNNVLQATTAIGKTIVQSAIYIYVYV